VLLGTYGTNCSLGQPYRAIAGGGGAGVFYTQLEKENVMQGILAAVESDQHTRGRQLIPQPESKKRGTRNKCKGAYHVSNSISKLSSVVERGGRQNNVSWAKEKKNPLIPDKKSHERSTLKISNRGNIRRHYHG